MNFCATTAALQTWDLIFVGGGLSSGLIAYRLKMTRPELKILIVEREGQLGGNHTWSFHHSDMSEEELAWLSPLITQTWLKNQVQFPDTRRTFDNPYSSILSSTLHEALARALSGDLLLWSEAKRMTTKEVMLAGGETLQAGCVIDGRGLFRVDKSQIGCLKFLGLDVELAEPHGIKYPIIMDTFCEQLGSFRFFYLLPWTETSLLIEDNRYTLDLNLDADDLRAEIRLYSERRGWRIIDITREEQGVLPVPLFSSFARPTQDVPNLSIGVGGGFFHYTTTYSIRHSVSLAEEFSRLSDFSPIAVSRLLTDLRSKHERRSRFYLMLNRMLLLRKHPECSYRLLERFYNMPQDLIQNFYADRMNATDRIRLMIGRPPLALSEALQLILRRPPRPQKQQNARA